MTFVEAIKTGRPMRRRHVTFSLDLWLALGYEGANSTTGTPRWREVATGRPSGLRSADYLADDWEVMP